MPSARCRNAYDEARPRESTQWQDVRIIAVQHHHQFRCKGSQCAQGTEKSPVFAGVYDQAIEIGIILEQRRPGSPAEQAYLSLRQSLAQDWQHRRGEDGITHAGAQYHQHPSYGIGLKGLDRLHRVPSGLPVCKLVQQAVGQWQVHAAIRSLRACRNTCSIRSSISDCAKRLQACS